jgi:hypothetical protein
MEMTIINTDIFDEEGFNIYWHVLNVIYRKVVVVIVFIEYALV